MSAAADQAAARHYERRAVAAEIRLASVALLHAPDAGRKAVCEECGGSWPCRTARMVGAS